MESNRQLGTSSVTAFPSVTRRDRQGAFFTFRALVVAILFCGLLSAGDVPIDAADGADIRYYYGVALAQLARWDEARAVLLAAQKQHADDERFPVELGGVAFKQKRYAEAAKWLRRALRLDPSDSYAADFLGTVYFLQGNLEAALQSWNRVGKPRIENLEMQPGLRVDSILLDRAFTFTPADTLALSDLLATRARIGGMGIFPTFDIRLNARTDGNFDATFDALEQNGFGNSKVQALVSTFRGIGYQTIHPDYFNIAQSTINLESMARWDPQKRRLMSSLSGPLGGDPSRRYRLDLDWRDENWDFGSSFGGRVSNFGTLQFRKVAVGGEVQSIDNGTWSWSAGGELSYRDYRDVSVGPGLLHDVLLKGYQMKQVAQVTHELWRVPERRLESNVRITSEAARIWAAPASSFERLQISLASRWFPRATGDDYAIQQQVRAGKIFGQTPLDEVFQLGLERDNDLWLRAHIGTRDGRKGSAPMGRQYFLLNWEIDKNIFKKGFFSLKLSPFVDIGSVDSSLGLGSGKWLWDTGVQAKFRVLGVGVALIYARDLRSGKNAGYVADWR